MKLLKNITKNLIMRNPVKLNIPLYAIGGAIDRLNFALNSLLLLVVFLLAGIQRVQSVDEFMYKWVVLVLVMVLMVNNVFKRCRDIYGHELSKSDKIFFAFITLIPIVNIFLFIYLGYKIGYLEIIKRRNALLKEMI